MAALEVLQGVDIFMPLAPPDLARLAERLQERSVAANEVLFQQGQPASCLFVIVGGTVELVQIAPDGRISVRQQIGEGEACGDVALFSGEPHAATATTLADSRVLALCREDFEDLIAARPWIMRSVLAAIARRVSQVNHQLVTDQPEAPETVNGRVVAVFSPRGGSGKTTLAVNLALNLAKEDPGRVALFDLDLVFADAAAALNLAPATALAAVAEAELGLLQKRLLGSLMTELEGHLRVLVATNRPEDGERISGAHVRVALAALRRQMRVTIVDCGSSLAEPTLIPLELADRVVIVCTPDLASLRDIRDCLRLFGQALHLDKRRITFCFNHPLNTTGLTRAQFESALEQRLVVEIPHAGDLSSSRRHSGFDKAVQRLMREVQPAPVPQHDGARVRRGPFSQLIQRRFARAHS